MGLHYEEGQAADLPERSIGAAGPGLHDHEAWAPQRHVGTTRFLKIICNFCYLES